MRLACCSLGIILLFAFGKGLDWRGIWIGLPFFLRCRYLVHRLGDCGRGKAFSHWRITEIGSPVNFYLLSGSRLRMLIWMECHAIYNLSVQNNQPEMSFYLFYSISANIRVNSWYFTRSLGVLQNKS
jgi:hypothetical protein